MIFIAYLGVGLACFLGLVFLVIASIDLSNNRFGETPKGIAFGMVAIWTASMFALVVGWYGVKAVNALAKSGWL